ncbi:MAG: GAF domain-containing protein, partial [Phycisphaerae bacterium]|nr:GAF domain-containing protein [Phycisphaerae bacterium]
MGLTSVTTSGVLESLKGAFPRLKSQMNQLGLNLGVWDCNGQCAVAPEPVCEFCRAVIDSGCSCSEEMRQHAESVVADARPAKRTSSRGCCMVGVPVYKRRRLVGAAVAIYPPSELLDDAELFRKTIRNLEIDETEATRLARANCRHSLNEADDFLHVLNWSLKHEQAFEVAREELDTLSVNLATTYEELSLLYRISGSMKVTQKVPEFFQAICNELLEVMNISAAAAVIYPRPQDSEDLIIVSGEVDLNKEQLRLLCATQIGPRFERNNRAVLDNKFHAPPDSGLGRAVENIIAAPLITETKPSGVLIGINKKGADFDSVDLKLINSIANQAAVFLANNSLYDDLQDLLMGVLHALTATIDAKDPYTCGHSHRVALVSAKLAQLSGFDEHRIGRIYLAGLL